MQLQQITQRIGHLVADKTIAGVAYNIDTGLLDVVVVKQQQQKLEIVKSAAQISDLSEVISNKTPIALALWSKHILHRSLHHPPDDYGTVLERILPNVATEHFCFQVYAPNQESTWISFTRRKIVLDNIESFTNKGYKIVQLTLGTFGVHYVLPSWSKQSGKIYTSNQILSVHQQMIQNVENATITDNSSSISIFDQSLQPYQIVPFASAFNTLYNLQLPLWQLPEVEHMKYSYKNEQFLKGAGVGFLVFCFILLLVNFVYFNHLTNKNTQLAVKLNNYRTQLVELDTLKAKLNRRYEWYSSKDNLLQSRVSYYIDIISASLPSGITLEEFNYAPILNKNQSKETLQFSDQVIKIIGYSNESNALNLWILRLEKFSWINSVVLLPYSEEKGGKGKFELEIRLE